MPKIVDHEQMRKELLTQSFHYFAYQGYKGVTMRSLAKALDISTGTLSSA
ncbi:MAG: TetR/AcrR family transcriptional regulator [Oligoflexales bacterium]|nr:TetR/AcrR family transcriptional regulator [Oligoflexales bacterium]